MNVHTRSIGASNSNCFSILIAMPGSCVDCSGLRLDPQMFNDLLERLQIVSRSEMVHERKRNSHPSTGRLIALASRQWIEPDYFFGLFSDSSHGVLQGVRVPPIETVAKDYDHRVRAQHLTAIVTEKFIQTSPDIGSSRPITRHVG